MNENYYRNAFLAVEEDLEDLRACGTLSYLLTKEIAERGSFADGSDSQAAHLIQRTIDDICDRMTNVLQQYDRKRDDMVSMKQFVIIDHRKDQRTETGE